MPTELEVSENTLNVIARYNKGEQVVLQTAWTRGNYPKDITLKSSDTGRTIECEVKALKYTRRGVDLTLSITKEAA